MVDPLTLGLALLRRILIELGVWPEPPRFDPLTDARAGDGSGTYG